MSGRLKLLVILVIMSIVVVFPPSVALVRLNLPTPVNASPNCIVWLSNSGDITVAAGSSGSNTVTITLVSGSCGTLWPYLLNSDLPSGASFSYVPSSGSPTFSSTLTISTSPSTPVGSYTIDILVYGDGLSGVGPGSGVPQGGSFNLIVQPNVPIVPPPNQLFDFSISVSPSSGSVDAGDALSNAGTVSLTLSGSAQSVSLSASGLPSNVGTTSFSPTSCTPTCTSTFSIQTVSSAPSGTYIITITGTGGRKTHSTTYTLTVNGAPPPASTTISCGFMLSVAPYSQTVVQGGTAVFALSMSFSNPSCAGSSVNLNNMDVTGLGPGMDWQVTSSGDSIAITTSPMTPPGSYALSLIFSVNGVQQQVGFTLIVNLATSVTTLVPTTQAFSFSVTVSPSSQSVQIGGSTSYVVSVVPLAGSPVPVSLTVMGLPGDVRSSFTTQSGVPPYTSTLNLDLSNSTASPGAYTLTVIGTAAGNVQSATATLMIEQNPTPTTIISPTTNATNGGGSDDNGGGIIVLAVLVLAVVGLGVLAMRRRGRRTTTQASLSKSSLKAGAPRTFCGKCGTENPASNEFCVNCGNKLKT